MQAVTKFYCRVEKEPDAIICRVLIVGIPGTGHAKVYKKWWETFQKELE